MHDIIVAWVANDVPYFFFTETVSCLLALISCTVYCTMARLQKPVLNITKGLK